MSESYLQKRTKKDNKVIKFKKSLSEVLKYVDEKCDAGDYSAALSALFFYASKKNVGYEVWAHIADIYSEMGLYERAIYCWMRYLQLCKDDDAYVDAYNGLGANYFFMGDKTRAGYYFDKQIVCPGAEDCVYNDILDEYANSMDDGLANDYRGLFRVVYSSDGKAEYKALLDAAVKSNVNGDYQNAIINAGKAAEYPKLRNDALYQRAYAEYSMGQISDALSDVEEVISAGFSNYKAYILAAYLYRALRADDRTNEILDDMLSFLPESDEERSRMIGFLYNFGRVDDVEKLLKRCLDESPYSGELLYLKGIVAYNNGNLALAERVFTKAYNFTLSPTIKYYRDLTCSVIAGRKQFHKVELLFDIPDEEADGITEWIVSLCRNAEKLPMTDISACTDKFDWAVSSGSESLQIAVGLICSKYQRYRKYLVLKLIEPNISDDVKRKYISMLAERLCDEDGGVSYSGYYKRVEFDVPFFDDRNYDLWFSAYSVSFGYTTFLTEDPEFKLTDAAVKLQAKLIKTKKLDMVTDINAIACAMFLYSGLSSHGFEKTEMIYGLFSTKREKVDEIFKMIEGTEND